MLSQWQRLPSKAKWKKVTVLRRRFQIELVLRHKQLWLQKLANDMSKIGQKRLLCGNVVLGIYSEKESVVITFTT